MPVCSLALLAATAAGAASDNQALLDKAKALFKPLPESVNCEGINQQVWSACARAWPQFEREVRDIADGGQSFGSGEYAPRTFNAQGGSSSFGSFALGSAVSFGGFGTDTGNCSLGQYLTKKIVDLGANGSGGSEVMVDPIIALKNIGDYMVASAKTIWIANAYASSLAIEPQQHLGADIAQEVL